MAKGSRSKYKKRQRNAKAAHLWDTRGKAALDRITDRLNDPNFETKHEYTMPPNAFLHPNNPNAVFPQVKRPEIIDLRSHKIKDGGVMAIGAFRKAFSKNAKKSKYATQVFTAEDLAAEANKDTSMAVEEAQEKEVVVRVASSKVTPDELAALTSKMVIDKKSKRRAAKEEAMETDIPKISIKSKAISKSRKKDTFKRSKRQLLH